MASKNNFVSSTKRSMLQHRSNLEDTADMSWDCMFYMLCGRSRLNNIEDKVSIQKHSQKKSIHNELMGIQPSMNCSTIRNTKDFSKSNTQLMNCMYHKDIHTSGMCHCKSSIY